MQTSLQVTQPLRKPRHDAAVEFSEAPMVGIGLGVGFFERREAMQRIVATDMHAIHRQRHDQDQAFKAICMLQLRGLQIEAAALEVGERRLNGLITNDKFCLVRTSRLALSWWRRPLRLRDPATATYFHEVSVPRGGADEAVMASAAVSADPPGRGAAVGSSLPVPAALGDANRAGGDR